MAVIPHIFLVLLLGLSCCFVHDTQGKLPVKKWFNPLRWKEYWKRFNLHHTVRKPLGVKSDEGQLKTGTYTYYVTVNKCCPGFERVPGQAGCTKAITPPKENLVEVAKSLNLSTLVQLVTAAGLGDALIDSSAKLTVFAPTNEAFSKVPNATLQFLLNNPEALANLLKFHVAPKKLPAEKLQDNQLIATLDSNNTLRVNIGGEPKTVVIQGAKVIKPNQLASNGIIHVVDSVLKPAEDSTLSYLESSAKYGILTELAKWLKPDLKNTTLFAPTDEAFGKWPSGRLETLKNHKSCANELLKYHIINKPVYSGVLSTGRVHTRQGSPVEVRVDPETKAVMINNAMVTKADISTTDGVVHEINRPLMPLAAMDIVEAAQAQGLTELVKFLESTGLADALRNAEQPLTLFAPTNEALQGLPESVKAQLESDPALLPNVLRYHVAPGELFTYAFGKDMMVNSLLQNATLRLNNFRYGKVHSVNGACIKISNIGACKGVIHVISKVLLPPTKSLYEAISSDSRLTNLTKAIDLAGLKGALDNPEASLTVFAPTDDAFSKFPALQEALKDKKLLTNVLQYHVSKKTFLSCALDCKNSYWSAFMNFKSIRTLNNKKLLLRLDPDQSYHVNDARAIVKDSLATNGVLNIIDKVLEPRMHFKG